jgi:nicotinamide riboside transporter PnuC
MFFILFFGVGIGDGHPKVDLLARIFGNLSTFFSKQQKNGNLLLGIVEKWWHFCLSFCVNFMKNQACATTYSSFYFLFFLGGHINLICNVVS